MLLLPRPALLPAALSELIALDRSCVLHQDPHCTAELPLGATGSRASSTWSF